jgi:hypothetical protein
MVFLPPSWVPKLSEIPDSISIPEFVFEEKYGRLTSLAKARPIVTCGVSGDKITALEAKDRVDNLAQGLAKEFGWQPNAGSEWDKVVGIFSANTVSST